MNGPENVWAVYSRLIGGKMAECEFCRGSGYSPKQYMLLPGVIGSGTAPCPECGGTGIQHCCEGLQADPVVDAEWPDNPLEGGVFQRVQKDMK